MNKDELKKFVNQIFKKAGDAPITGKFAAEFADGIRYQRLFNLLYDESIDCKLAPSTDPAQRIINWNKINRKLWQRKSQSLLTQSCLLFL